MKTYSNRNALNPAFKRFQYLPHLTGNPPSKQASTAIAVLAQGAPGEVQRQAASLSNLLIASSTSNSPDAAASPLQ